MKDSAGGNSPFVVVAIKGVAVRDSPDNESALKNPFVPHTSARPGKLMSNIKKINLAAQDIHSSKVGG
jgi:hypothetical protein